MHLCWLHAICTPADQSNFTLRAYLDKTISLHINKGRKVSGTLRGFDQFMNIVLGDAVEEVSVSENKNIGMVVRACGIS